MSIRIIKDYLSKRPFTPFRVVSSSGQAYDVRHPENAIIISGGLVVAHGGNRGGLPQHVVTLPLMHITGIENLPDDGRRQHR